jgi:molybdenum-dependent DNA-binding transcriptional regulator ModE
MNIVQAKARAAIKAHGGLRKAAKALGVNYTTLSLLANAKRLTATERTLQALGLTKEPRIAR